MNIKLVKNYNQIRPDRATLFCFPFAGGGASAYNSWVQKMKDKVTVCPIQLEGTEKVDNTVYIWYNVSIKYRRCFYDRTTAEIGAKSIHGNI